MKVNVEIVERRGRLEARLGKAHGAGLGMLTPTAASGNVVFECFDMFF